MQKYGMPGDKKRGITFLAIPRLLSLTYLPILSEDLVFKALLEWG